MNKLRRAAAFLGGVVLAIACIEAGKAQAESYSYVELKAGSFFDACHIDTCWEPDGKLPAYAALGHEWIFGDFVYGFEFQHRSNLDIGWPVKGDTGTEEYDRNGFFLKTRYRFNYIP